MAGENYRGIWVYAEQQEGRLEPAVFEILAKAKQLSAHSGEEVTALQQMLWDTGFIFEEPDGVFGRNTEKAVKWFQE